MKKIWPIILFFALRTTLAQEIPVIDSLKKYIATAPDDSTKVNALYELGMQYPLFRSKDHIPHFITALNLAKKIGYKPGIKKAYNSLTSYLFYKDMLGVAMQYSFEYLKFLETEGTEKERYSLYHMLGNLYVKQDSVNQARKYYHRVLRYREKNSTPVAYGNSLTSLLIVNMADKEYDSALIYGYRAVEVFKKNDLQSEMANAILGMSEILIAKKNYEGAEQKIKESYSIYSAINNPHGICNSLYVMGQIYLNQGRTDMSIDVNKRCLVYADSLSLLVMVRDCHKTLSTLYDQKNDFKNAYENQVLYKKFEDSLAVEDQKGKMLEVEVKYDISKKENLLLEQQFEIDTKNKQRNFLLLGIAAIIVLLFISYRAYKQKKSSSEIIAKQKELVEDKQKEILDSINYARRIQSAILAKEVEIKKHLPESFLLYKPKDIVAGDFYFFEVTDTHIFYAAADCTGHGVPGALMSVVCSNSLTRCVKEFGLKDPGQILDKARVLVVETLKKSGEEVKDGMDISLLALSKNNPNDIKWAGANNPLWYTNNGIFSEIKADKQPIGLYDSPKPFTAHPLALSKGDMIYLFTDGYADQFGGPKGKKFKYKQLEEMLTSIATKTISDQSQILEEKFLIWKGELDQIDDVCIIGIRI